MFSFRTTPIEDQLDRALTEGRVACFCTQNCWDPYHSRYLYDIFRERGNLVRILRPSGSELTPDTSHIDFDASDIEDLDAIVVEIQDVGSRYFNYTRDVMRLLISSDEIWQATVRFLDWRVYGFFFIFVGVMFRAFFIGITRTKVLTLNAIVMAVTNIVLDYLLVFGHAGFPRMGLEGAAIASVIAEAVSILFYFIYIWLTVDRAKYGLSRFRSFDFGLLKRVLDISIFTMFQYFISLSTYFILFIAVEHLGQRSLAIANIVRSLYVVMLIPINALSMTTSTFVSNCIGAGRTDEVMPVIRHISFISIAVTALIVGVLCLRPELVLSVYTGDNSLIEASVPTFYVIACALPVAAFSNIVFNGLTGTGNTRVAFVIETVTLCFYLLFIYVVAIRLQMPVSICFLTEVIYYVGLFLLSVIYLRKGNWRGKKI